MRKIISISFLLVFFTGNTGYYIFYACQQHEIKEAVERRLLSAIPDSAMELIVAEANASFRWEEEGKEFYQDGEMYDVAKSIEKNGRTLLYCVNDKKETQLLLQWSKAAGQQNDKGETTTEKVQVIDLFPLPILYTTNAKPVLAQKYFYQDTAVIAFDKEVKAPPPRA